MKDLEIELATAHFKIDELKLEIASLKGKIEAYEKILEIIGESYDRRETN